MDNIRIRPIEPQDNTQVADVIRNALKEFKANRPGTVYFDETTDRLYELFRGIRGIYHVAVMDGHIIGGAGVYPTAGLDPDTCELVKLYLSPRARGKGLGKLLMQKCLSSAIAEGYKKVYLETMPELITAIPMYEQFGFTYLDGPLGNSGHTGCAIWMIKLL